MTAHSLDHSLLSLHFSPLQQSAPPASDSATPQSQRGPAPPPVPGAGSASPAGFAGAPGILNPQISAAFALQMLNFMNTEGAEAFKAQLTNLAQTKSAESKPPTEHQSAWD